MLSKLIGNAINVGADVPIITLTAEGRFPTRAGSNPTIYAPLDQPQLGKIREALGDARTENLLALFARELSTRPAAVRNCIGCGDLAGAASEAHSLKGAALSIGGSAVGRAAEQIEIALGLGGRPATGTALHRAMRQLDSAVAATLAALPPEPPIQTQPPIPTPPPDFPHRKALARANPLAITAVQQRDRARA